MTNDIATPQGRVQICQAMVGSIRMYGGAGDLRTADHFYGRLVNACERFPDEADLRGLLAAGAAAMADHHGRSGNLEEAAGFINDLRGLCSDYPAEEPHWNFLAEALFTHALYHGNHGQWGEVEQIYRALQTVAGWFPERVFIQEQFAMVAYNYSVGLLGAGKVEEVFALFHELRVLSVRVSASPRIRASLGRLCFNLSTTQKLEEMQPLCRELRLMVDAHPSESELRLHAAMATCNVATGLAIRGRVTEAVLLYDVIAGWAEQYPEARELREQRTLAARNIIIFAESGWDTADASKLFRDVAAAVTADPENSTFREWCAESAGAFWTKAVKSGDKGQAEMAYLVLAGLANRFPADVKLREVAAVIRSSRESILGAPPGG